MKHVKGSTTLQRRLREMPKRLRNRVIGQTTRATAKAFIDLAKPHIPVSKRKNRGHQGHARNRLSVRASKNNGRASKGGKVWIGHASILKAPTGAAFYMFFVEHGWRPARHSNFTPNLPVMGERQVKRRVRNKDTKKLVTITETKQRRADLKGNASRKQMRKRKDWKKASANAMSGGKVPGLFVLRKTAKRNKTRVQRQIVAGILRGIK